MAMEVHDMWNHIIPCGFPIQVQVGIIGSGFPIQVGIIGSGFPIQVGT